MKSHERESAALTGPAVSVADRMPELSDAEYVTGSPGRCQPAAISEPASDAVGALLSSSLT